MTNYPTCFKLSSGVGNAPFPLNAFDRALIKAGISNYNLIRVSSILPKNVSYKDHIDLEEGSCLPTAYATIRSNVPGETLCTAVAVGIPQDPNHIGVIMEYSGKNQTSVEAEKIIHEMVQTAMNDHGIPYSDIKISSTEATVPDNGMYTALISALCFW